MNAMKREKFIPRHLSYMKDNLPCMPIRKIVKRLLGSGAEDSLTGAYDRVDEPSLATRFYEIGKIMTNDPGVVDMTNIRKRIASVEFADNLAELLDQKAAQHGDQILANFFQDSILLTYSSLAEKSKKLASSFIRLGIRKGSHVALLASNSEPFLVAWFAIARLGAVMVPLNNRYKSPELEFALKEIDVQYIVIDEEYLPTLNGVQKVPDILNDGGTIVIGSSTHKDQYSYDRLLEEGNNQFISPEPVGKTDLLSIQFTSGTTGQPKGCMQSHLYWLMIAATTASQRVLTDELKLKNVLVTYPLYYMMAQMETLLAIHNSGTAFIARRPSLSSFMGWVREHEIHYCAMNPMVYRGLPVNSDDHVNKLRHIAAYYHKGSELRALESRFNAVGRDSFGMTEIGRGAYLPASASHMIDAGTCGLPAPFRQARICDDLGNELETGKIGELCFAGPGMFWGYYKRPKANRDGFHDGHWFRTGDLAKIDSNGYIYIVGRIKEMIKRSGENISAMEVESVLREHPDIQEAAVLAVPDKSRMEEVMAYITLRNDKCDVDVTPMILELHCKARLADFKVPRYFSYIKEFPRTGSDKIDKPRLKRENSMGEGRTYDRVDGAWI